jgi:hypothetical protein
VESDESDVTFIAHTHVGRNEVLLPYRDANEIHGRTTEAGASPATRRLEEALRRATRAASDDHSVVVDEPMRFEMPSILSWIQADPADRFSPELQKLREALRDPIIDSRY